MLILIRSFFSEDIPPTIEGYPFIDRQYITWIINTDLLPSYDVFISHRWNENDYKVVSEFYEAFLSHTVGSEKRNAPDKVRLQPTLQFQEEFGKGLFAVLLFHLYNVRLLCR